MGFALRFYTISIDSNKNVVFPGLPRRMEARSTHYEG